MAKETALQRDKRECRERGGLIYEATVPLLDAAVAMAEERARAKIDKAQNELIFANWDRAKVAPYPKSNQGRMLYQAAAARYQFIHRITRATGTVSRRPGDPDPCEFHHDGARRYIEEQKQMAALQYHEYVYKLTRKVGGLDGITRVTLDAPYGVWDNSVLEVSRDDARERWVTKTIYNHSVLGKTFLQWPTRKVR